MTDPREQLAELVRVEGVRVVAVLTRTLGDLGRAEDAVQEASIAALQTWPVEGIPREPRAWLLTVARRKALDVLRREARRAEKEAQATELLALEKDLEVDPVVESTGSSIDDDLLRLAFTCCHPALAQDAQVALTLRTVCGLQPAQIARVLLIPESTLAKRLVRTRQKISRAGIPYRVPSDAELPDRLAAVAAVVYLVFTAGYAGDPGGALVRFDLCTEAIRLARLLGTLLPGEPQLQGLLALLLLTHARRDARVDRNGDLILLAEQDRSRWHGDEIREGIELLDESLRRTGGLADRFQLEAAIAACHVTGGSTDWSEVVRLYDLLLDVAPSASVRLNRAVAVAERDGPETGLALIESLGMAAGRAGAPGAFALDVARAELLRRLGREGEAATAYASALGYGPSVAESRFLRRRLAELSEGPAG